jgi:protein SCO1/2
MITPLANAKARPGAFGALLGALLCLALAGCGSQAPAPEAQEQRYALRGTVISIDREQQRIVVDHEDIPGFMAAMAMPYPVVEPALLDVAAPGDQITADVVVANNSAHLENIVVVQKAEPKPGGQVRPGPPAERAPGFQLVNQDGKTIRLDQYRGKAVLVTLIYTRCPLADYCPLASHNFAEIEKALAKDPTAYQKTHLLSISFDSDYDTPEVLRNYSKAYMAKPAYDHWEFATIPNSSRTEVTRFFNLFLIQEEGQFTHSMKTAIIAPDGTMQRWYSGTEWKPTDVLADLTKVALAAS